jgi:hypothetical protein
MSIAGKAGTETPSLANLNEGEKVIFAKIAWRILPLLSLAYIINFIDRNNAGFAGLTMIKDIGITQSEFGFGVGVLSAGYCLFEVPSNIALYKFGARVWLARIMITWGVISMAMMFAQGAFSFSALRFLLGAAVPDQHSCLHSRRGSDIELVARARSMARACGLEMALSVRGIAGCRRRHPVPDIPVE